VTAGALQAFAFPSSIFRFPLSPQIQIRDSWQEVPKENHLHPHCGCDQTALVDYLRYLTDGESNGRRVQHLSLARRFGGDSTPAGGQPTMWR